MHYRRSNCDPEEMGGPRLLVSEEEISKGFGRAMQPLINNPWASVQAWCRSQTKGRRQLDSKVRLDRGLAIYQNPYGRNGWLAFRDDL
jgi:hypothetical protein